MKATARSMLGIALAASLAIDAGCCPGPALSVGDAERALFPRPADFAAWLHVKPADPASNETFSIARSWDGSVDVDYTFDGSEPATGRDPLYIRGTASLQPTRKDAALVQGSFKIGMNIGGRKDGLTLRAIPGFMWGDAVDLGVLATRRGDIGNYVLARRDRRVWMLMVVGSCTTNAAEWGAFVRPWLDRFEAYRGPARQPPGTTQESPHTGLASPESRR